MAPQPDCRTCGICCVAPYEQDSFADLTERDAARLGKRFVRLHVVNRTDAIRTRWSRQRTGPMAGYEMMTCAMLRGSVMSRVSCRVYERRPRACREALQPGDRTCRALRRAAETWNGR